MIFIYSKNLYSEKDNYKSTSMQQDQTKFFSIANNLNFSNIEDNPINFYNPEIDDPIPNDDMPLEEPD